MINDQLAVEQLATEHFPVDIHMYSNIQQSMMLRIMETLFTEEDYRQALQRFMEICDAPEDSPEANELEKLMYYMQLYEQDNCS